MRVREREREREGEEVGDGLVLRVNDDEGGIFGGGGEGGGAGEFAEGFGHFFEYVCWW